MLLHHEWSILFLPVYVIYFFLFSLLTVSKCPWGAEADKVRSRICWPHWSSLTNGSLTEIQARPPRLSEDDVTTLCWACFTALSSRGALILSTAYLLLHAVAHPSSGPVCLFMLLDYHTFPRRKVWQHSDTVLVGGEGLLPPSIYTGHSGAGGQGPEPAGDLMSAFTCTDTIVPSTRSVYLFTVYTSITQEPGNEEIMARRKQGESHIREDCGRMQREGNTLLNLKNTLLITYSGLMML